MIITSISLYHRVRPSFEVRVNCLSSSGSDSHDSNLIFFLRLFVKGSNLLCFSHHKYTQLGQMSNEKMYLTISIT